MQHSILITEEIMHANADYADSRGLWPELIFKLIMASIKNPAELRIPFGGSTGQPGWDVSVSSPYAFPPYVPEGQSFWEISASNDPEGKASENFDKRTRKTSVAERKSSTFVFVTPRSAYHGWSADDQKKWIEQHLKASDWKNIIILDATKLVQWLYQFPGIDFWLAEQFNIPTKGLSSPYIYWEVLKSYGSPPDLKPEVFLIGQDKAVEKLLQVFRGESQELLLETRYPEEGIDFVTAVLAFLDLGQRNAYAGRCLIIDDPETWKAMCYLHDSHVFVAAPSLDVLSTGDLRIQARNKGHGIVFAGIPLSGVHGNSVRLAEAKQYNDMEKALVSSGYQTERARLISNRCGGRVIILKRLLLDISASPDWALTGMASELAIADLIGQWDGNFEGDRKAIEGILGKPYGEWIGKIRPMSLRPDPPLIQRDEKWRFISRFEGWQSLGPYLSNDDLDRFQKQALIVLREKDPKFTLPIDERWNASIRGSNPTYSDALKEGLAETLALLGSYPKALSSCTPGKPESVAAITVREILKDADWVQWASLNNVLPLIAEASPEQFLNAIDNILNDPGNSVFQDLFGQESTSFGGWNYMTGVLWALETLAWHKDYLSRVAVILGCLAGIDPGGNWGNRPSNSLTTIFLPWLPQTCAPIEIRKVAAEALLKECPAVAWNLLLKLLPRSHQVSSGSRRPSWQEFIPSDHSDNVSKEDYLEQVSIYTSLTVRAAKLDIKKLSELIERLDNLTPQAYSEVLEHLSSEAVLNLSEQEKTSLWEALMDIVTKHRTFKDAAWVMHREYVDRIAGVADMLKPISPELVHRRLFCQHHQLIEDIDNYQEQLIKLDERRAKAIKEILDFSGIEGVLNFARSVTDSQQVGLALGGIGTDKFDSFLLPKFLVHCEKPMESVTTGYVWSRFAKSGWPWIDSIKVDDWTDDQKAALLILLPFSQETWDRVKILLKDKEALYWKKTETRPYHLKEELPEAVKRLLEYGRARAAIQCLYWMAHEKMAFDINLVYRALMENLKSEESVDSMDQHACRELIQWLQNNPEADNDILTTIEWHYLSLLDSHFGSTPETLERRLAEDPNFFCFMIQVTFRSKKEETPAEEPSEADKRIATNAFELLYKWKTPPGSKPDGSFDGATLKKWLEEVKHICEDSGHLRIALDQTGKVLAHSPADPSGLWIHKAAAEVLDEKEHDVMRTAFWVELSNQRSVFTWTAGEAERALAADFYRKADALEIDGYINLAASVRVLAKSYERDAEREALEDPF